MKVTIPENISEVTLEQYQEFNLFLQKENIKDVDIERKSIEVFAGVPKKHIKNIQKKDYDFLLESISKALNTDVEFQNFFTLNEVKYGFNPNLDKMSQGEWMDIVNYQKDIQEYHRLMAILFRKVIKTDSFGNYEIEKYNGTGERAELFKKMPMNIVNGALVFFYNLAKELRMSTQKSIREEVQKAVKQGLILKSGAGTLQ